MFLGDLVRVSIAVIKDHDQELLQLSGPSPPWREVRIGIQGGKHSRSYEDWHLLPCSHGLLSLPSLSTQENQPRGGTTRSEHPTPQPQ